MGEDLCQAGGPNGEFACSIPPKTAKNPPYRCNCSIVSILRLAGFRLWALDFPCTDGVWCRDGYYPEDTTPKCSFLTTCLPWLGELRSRGKQRGDEGNRHDLWGEDEGSSEILTGLSLNGSL